MNTNLWLIITTKKIDETEVKGLIAHKVLKNEQKIMEDTAGLKRREQRIKNSFKTVSAALISSEYIINA